MSHARLVKQPSSDQSTYSVLVCTGGALDHMGIVFVNGDIVPHFSLSRKSFALSPDAQMWGTPELGLLQNAMFVCAQSSAAHVFGCDVEFLARGVCKVSAPIDVDAIDASRRVLLLDVPSGKIVDDRVEHDSDVLVPSTEFPAPPPTGPGGHMEISNDSGFDVPWKHLTDRAATAAPAAPWAGLDDTADASFYETLGPEIARTRMQSTRY